MYGQRTWIILDHVTYSLNLDGESFAAWTGLKEGEWTERLVVRNEINGLPVTYLPSTAFYGTNVYEVVLPNMLTLIQDSVFQNSDITKLTIPASVDRVGQWLATGCKNLETVAWNTTTDIPDFSFSDDIKLQQVKLAEGLERIGYGTFSNCVSLNDIELPETLTSEGTEKLPFLFKWKFFFYNIFNFFAENHKKSYDLLHSQFL